jgi:hypothetical protein
MWYPIQPVKETQASAAANERFTAPVKLMLLALAMPRTLW